MGVLRKIFPTKNEKELKKLRKIAQKVSALEEKVKKLKDSDFPGETQKLRDLIQQGASRADVLPMGFALVREAAYRTLAMRHFDVQIMGGVVLLDGKVAEMATGEGKTLVATLPSYVVALEGRGAHIVTVNDYLAKRDATWMSHVFEFLGMSVGFIQNDMDQEERATNYGKDITYITNNELGFDYLRDNMRGLGDPKVLRDLHFAIVDEVDSILIDEARTPLIISGPSNVKVNLCELANGIVKLMKPNHFDLDEKSRNISLTEEGMSFVEDLLKNRNIIPKESSLYDVENSSLVHFVTQALKAWNIFQRNKDYIVRNNKVHIIDEFTGRIMEGRRFSDNLHQALEAKESVPILQENQTLASVTYQNLFRLYKTLSGMSGTVATEAVEFSEIYKLSCVTLPTNKPLKRKDCQDLLFATFDEKIDAIVQKVKASVAKKQPVLIGTVSIEKSEIFSRALKNLKIPHNVLNAKNHKKEALIVAEAGQPGAVTIATNMAGRGTDIKLGGNVDFYLENKGKDLSEKEVEATREEFKGRLQEVVAAGGLLIIGTERHESRRIDNQLRGRSGRQGDPGESIFYLCLEDDLMRIFAGDKIQFLMSKMNNQKGEPIEHKLITRSIERAQSRVEAQNYEVRKHLLSFDDVSNNQREMVYQIRREIIDHEKSILEILDQHIHDVSQHLSSECFPQEEISPSSVKKYCEKIQHLFHSMDCSEFKKLTKASAFSSLLTKSLKTSLLAKVEGLDETAQNTILHFILLTTDSNWRQHLSRVDGLKQGINLRSYAQGSPLIEFKKESFDLFVRFLSKNSLELVAFLFNNMEKIISSFDSVNPSGDIKPPSSRNSPCPCGSGKKYKHCHGDLAKG